MAAYDLGVPLVTLNEVRGTTTLDVYAPPDHFWQSVQWQSAVTAGSPRKRVRKRSVIQLCNSVRSQTWEAGIEISSADSQTGIYSPV